MRDVPSRRTPGTPAWRKYHAIDFSRYVFAQPYIVDKAVLDAGCGAGYGADYLAQQGARRVIGIDFSSEAIAYCKQHYQRPNLTFEVMDCTKLTFPAESFDVICCFGSFEQLQGVETALVEMKRVLRRDGIFLASVPNGEDVYQFQSMAFDLHTFGKLLKGHFRKVELWGQSINSAAYRSQQERLGMKCHRINHCLDKVFFLPWSLRGALLAGIWKLVFAGNQWIYHRFIDNGAFELAEDDVVFSRRNVSDANILIGLCRRV